MNKLIINIVLNVCFIMLLTLVGYLITPNYNQFIVFTIILLLLSYFFLFYRTALIFIYISYIFLSILLPYSLINTKIGIEFSSYDYINTITLVYIASYLFVLLISYAVFNKLIKDKSFKVLNQKFKIKIKNTNYLLVLVFLISSISKWYLNSIGHFQMIDTAENTRFVEVIKVLADLNLIVLLSYGYFINKKIIVNNRSLVIYFVFIVISLYFALLSYSRFQVIFIFLILIYSHFEHIKKFLLLYILFIPLMFYVFPVLSAARKTKSLDFIALLYEVNNKQSNISTILDILIDRFNYIGVIDKVVIQYQDITKINIKYFDNLISLIPRILWENKPMIGMKLNQVGKELGILQEKDFMTSVGLHVIGESFYLLQYYGILIAIFQAYIFILIEKKIGKKSCASYSLYFILSFAVIITDSYTYILPKLILYFFILLPFLLLWNKNMEENNVKNNYRN